MTLIAIGFVAVFALSYVISANVGRRRQSTSQGFLAGVLSYILLLGLYLAALAIWVRSLLLTFINEKLPLLIDRVMDFVLRFAPIQETL